MSQFTDELLLILLVVYVVDISYRLSGWFAKRAVINELRKRNEINFAISRSEPMSFGPSIFSSELWRPSSADKAEKMLRELTASRTSGPFVRARMKRMGEKIRGASGTVKLPFMLDPMDRGVVLEADDGRTYEGWRRGRVVINDIEYSAITRPSLSSRSVPLIEGCEVKVTDVAMNGNRLYVIVEPAEAESRSKNQPQ